MFKEERDGYHFQWKDLGDISGGRPNLGQMTHVVCYRLMQYTMRDVLIKTFGVAKTNEVLFQAGKLAGTEFCKNLLDVSKGFDHFVADLHQKLLDLNVGVLRIESSIPEKMEFVITVEEDLDCSGLPVYNETVCDYDEGFIAGILEQYSKKEFDVKEVDCWASGERVCRFKAKLK